MTAGSTRAVMLIAAAFCASAASAQLIRDAAVTEEVERQRQIYQSGGEAVPEGYVVGRSLLSYAYVLAPEFRRSLGNLGPDDRWLDVGAGEGRAVLEYASGRYEAILQGRNVHGAKAQAVAMSIEDRRTRAWYEAADGAAAGRIQYLFGKRLREYLPEELGRFELITDVLGGFSYTRFLSVYMEKALNALVQGGTLYTVLQDVRSETGTNRPFYAGSPFLTEIVNADGSQMTVCSWLKRIKCAEVACELNAEASPPIERYRVHKVCDDVAVPPLSLVHFQAGTPPERRFRLER